MSQPCPPAERWKEHLDGNLPAGEEAVLTEHLDGCAVCRKTLETLAGGGDSLLGVAREAGEATDASTPALREVVAQLKPPTLETQAEPAGERDDSLAFLTPSARPGFLGRLGPYEVQAVIGKGGFGIVLKAFDERLHRVVAIKVLAPAFANNGAARLRFLREARAAAAVKNDHVVGIHDVQGEGPSPYLVMEYIEGVSLQDKLDKAGTVGVKEILRIGMQIAEGLAAAHKQGLVHRDIKPANILLENGVERVKITDFGLARAVDDASVTQSGVVAGTPMYMSPQQAEGLPVDHRSDLFSLGTVLYTMCTGHPPFRATGTHAVLKRVIDASPRPIREINSEIPDWLCAIIAKLHAKKPEDRIQTAKELADLLGQRLADLQAGRAIRSEPSRASDRPEATLTGVSTPAPLLHGSPRLPRYLTFAVVCVVAVVFGWWFRPHAENTKKHEPDNPPFVPVFGGPDWRRLYNGQDLAGWKVFGEPRQSGGVIALPAANDIETIDEMPHHFHLRMEVKLVTAKATIGLQVAPRDPVKKPLVEHGWFVTLSETRPAGHTRVTVDLSTKGPNGGIGMVNAYVVEYGQWFYLEIITKDTATDVLVNGRKILHAAGVARAGVLRLSNTRGPESRVEFRNIEIKDLTPVSDDPDRRAAKMLIPYAGLEIGYEDGKTEILNVGQRLPDKRFDVAFVNIPEKPMVPPDFVKRILFPAIKDLTKLRGLDSQGPVLVMDDDELAQLSTLPCRKNLDSLAFRFSMSEKTFDLLKCFPSLRYFGCNIEKVDANRLTRFSEMTGLEWLRWLGVGNLQITSEHAKVLSNLNLTEFRLFHAAGVDKDFFSALRKMSNLEAVEFSGANLSDQNLAELTPLKKLKWLNVQWNKLTDAALLHLKKMDKLRDLLIDGNKISEKAVKELGEALPQCRIRYDGGEIPPRINASGPVSPDPAWVQLFNGKDLTGWSAGTNAKAWKVVGSELVGADKATVLRTDRKNSTDFHLRAELKLRRGDQAAIGFHNTSEEVRVGIDGDYATVDYIAPNGVGFTHQGINPKEILQEEVKPIRVEVITKLNHIEVKLNNRTIIKGRLLLPVGAPDRSGPIVLKAPDSGREVRFRKIEIKELPPTFKDDKERLQGAWIAVDLEEGGKNQKEGLNVVQWLFTFTGDRCHVKSMTRDGRTSLDQDGLFLTDLDTKPKRFRLVMPSDEKQVRELIGIYKFQGEYLRICYGGHPGVPVKVAYPTEFATKAGSPLQLMTLKRLAAAEPGWVQLFNGKGLAGWVEVFDKKKYATAPWDIVEPVLVLKGGKGQPTGYLRTEKQYREFHLRFEFKLTSFAPTQAVNNSHVYWGMQGPDDPSTVGWIEVPRGVEAKRADLGGGLELFIATGQPCGTVFWGKKGINKDVPWTNITGGKTPADTWNRAEIISKAGALEIRINGVSSVTKGYQPIQGHIGLFSSEQGLHLRNIEIRELPAAAGL